LGGRVASVASFVGRNKTGVWMLAVAGRDARVSALHYAVHVLADLVTSFVCVSKTPAVTEAAVRDNVDLVYQILEHVVVNGHVIHSDVGVVKRLVKPRGWVDNLVTAVTGSAGNVSSKDVSTVVPWRVAQPSYTNNEVFLDLVEQIDAVMEAGRLVHANLSGSLYLTSQLSGTPDLLLHLSGVAKTLDTDSVSLHPCVRLQRWKKDKVLSFVPFESGVDATCGGRLLTYAQPVTSLNNLPLWIKTTHTTTGNSTSGNRGSLQITLNPRIPLANVVIVVTLSNVSQVQARSTTGEWRWEQVPGSTGRGLWGVGKLGDKDRSEGIVSMTINYELSDGQAFPTVFADFVSFAGYSVSGVRIDTLQVLGEPYAPFKGCKMVVRSGRYTLRI